MTAWNLNLFDEEPEPYGPQGPGLKTVRGNGTKTQARRTEGEGAGRWGLRRGGEPVTEITHNPLGAPPLDWWVIDG